VRRESKKKKKQGYRGEDHKESQNWLSGDIITEVLPL
jgi:hypothetical protein